MDHVSPAGAVSGGGYGPCFKKATSIVCACNILAVFCILCYVLLTPAYLYISASSSSSSSSLSAARVSWTPPQGVVLSSTQVARIREAFEARKAMEPVELIKRVKEIKEESSRLYAARNKRDAELSDKLKELRRANAKKNQQDFEAVWKPRV